MTYKFDITITLPIVGELEECSLHGKAEITERGECDIDEVFGNADGMLLRQKNFAPHMQAIAAAVLEDYNKPRDDNDQKHDIRHEEKGIL